MQHPVQPLDYRRTCRRRRIGRTKVERVGFDRLAHCPCISVVVRTPRKGCLLTYSTAVGGVLCSSRCRTLLFFLFLCGFLLLFRDAFFTFLPVFLFCVFSFFLFLPFYNVGLVATANNVNTDTNSSENRNKTRR